MAISLPLRAQAAPQTEQEPNDLTFDIRGIDPSVANALRRILIAEVSRPWLTSQW